MRGIDRGSVEGERVGTGRPGGESPFKVGSWLSIHSEALSLSLSLSLSFLHDMDLKQKGSELFNLLILKLKSGKHYIQMRLSL